MRGEHTPAKVCLETTIANLKFRIPQITNQSAILN
jgi:hypothetical protein